MELLHKRFRSNTEISVSSVIKDWKYYKAIVTLIEMKSKNIRDNVSVLQLYLDSGKARELKRNRQSQKMVRVKYFFHCLLVYFIFNWQGRGVIC